MDFCVIYLLGGIAAVFLNTAALFAEAQCSGSAEFAQDWRRRDAGASCLFACFLSTIWPLGIPIVFFITGFYQRGLSLDFKNGPRSLHRQRSA